jgi:hypothetical protein
MPINFVHTIELGELIAAAIGALMTVMGLVLAVWQFNRQQKKSDDLQRTEIYQRLEMESTNVFRFEADNAHSLERFRDRQPVARKFDATWAAVAHYQRIENGEDPDVIDSSGALKGAFAEIEDDVRVLRKYYEMSLNLFEVAARFRHQGIIDAQVFGSWVIWMYETSREWGFRWMWPLLKANYMPQLRDVFEYPVAYFDWASEPDAQLKRDFFIHVARLLACPEIAAWIDGVDAQTEALHAEISRRGLPQYRKSWPVWVGPAPAPKPRPKPAPGPLPPLQ